MKYAVVIEVAGSNYSAYAPDLPGVISVGDTVAEAEANIREAIALYLDATRADGLAPESPSTVVEYIDVEQTRIAGA